uniref:AlNc14C47G3792 protein n=1 Tax=Albugo laibachii Nc14 TaxID=890382 RepID=F0WAS9_9STRA|nr:AlNc14C47G3792 [Albugo laibachii Nc14]|eukprot:CCA18251.1 AlNc14C47G3792 [Albugo laibachii Nc14]
MAISRSVLHRSLQPFRFYSPRPHFRSAITMGSYLTIINNTELTYECKVGVHESVLAKSLFGVAVASGALAGLSITAFIGSLLIHGVATATVTSINLILVTISGGGMFGMHLTGVFGPKHQLKSMRMTTQQFDYFDASSVSKLNIELEKKKFFELKAGESHQYGKMTLGLLRQATCVRNVYLSNVSMDMEVLVVQPIWSSVVPNRNRNYDLKAAMLKTSVKHYRVNSAKFMDYENKTFSAQPIVLVNKNQNMTTTTMHATSTSMSPSETANPPPLDNSQPAVGIPIYQKGYGDGVPSGSGPNHVSSEAQYVATPTTVVSSAGTSVNTGTPILPSSSSIKL